METNRSIMSCNPAHYTNGFEESSTPGILIPEDIRALSFNKLAFSYFTLFDTDTPAGYQISSSVFGLAPMTIPNRPAYSGPGQFFSTDSIDQTTTAGRNATFVATTNGIAAPQFQWQFNNVPIPDETGPTLFIGNSSPEQAGTYSVIVSGGAAPITSNVANLAILNPESSDLYVAAEANTGTLTVTASSSATPWTASSDAPWITIVSGASGAGTAGVGYAISANDTGAERRGTLSVAGKTFTITQAARR